MTHDLNDTNWDCIVLGHGVSALWMAHAQWSAKKNVLWITSEEPTSPERAFLRNGWLWAAPKEMAMKLVEQLPGFENPLTSFEAAYFDVKSSKRFRRLNELKVPWGDHEKTYFQNLESLLAHSTESHGLVDLWDWHSRLTAFHSSGASTWPTCLELFRDPRFVRVQGWPVLEIKTESSKISQIVIAGLKQATEVSAQQIYIGDYDEVLSTLVQNETDREAFASVTRGRTYVSGFGTRLWHKPLDNAIVPQTLIVPLVANPSSSGAHSHVVGRFIQTQAGLESFWIGLLTDEELEDNNEILKKIKQAKRALDRAIPGFADSIQKEAVSFEPRMCIIRALPSKQKVCGAHMLSDHFGLEGAIVAYMNNLSLSSSGALTAKEL